MRLTKTFLAVSAAFCSTIVLAYTPGTYTASVAGQNGPVAVEVQTSADKILSVKVSDQKETQNIGTHAVEQLPAKIVEAQSADVPAVSGASVTSKAIKTAVQECLDKASGKKTAASPLKDGTYEAKAYGNNGWLNVKVVIKDHKISEIQTPGQRETKFLGDTAIREIGRAHV